MKTEKQVQEMLKVVESDERLIEYPSANVMTNAPLALEQTALATRANTLREILGLPLMHYPKKKKGGKK